MHLYAEQLFDIMRPTPDGKIKQYRMDNNGRLIFEGPPDEQYGTTMDRKAVLHTDPHYTDQRFNNVQTIFGRCPEDATGLMSNFSDRLQYRDGGEDWERAQIALDGYAKAKSEETGMEEEDVKRTAEAIEFMLSVFWKRPVDLVQLMAGCNKANGHSYLVYRYRWREEEPEEADFEDDDFDDEEEVL